MGATSSLPKKTAQMGYCESMNQSYGDITDKLGEPLWWDECGVPRYEPFTPGLCNDIYAEQAVLMKIACQGCGREFLVADSWSKIDAVMSPSGTSLVDMVKNRTIHYGDPPNYGCCAAGPTMNCEDLEVVEFWKRNHEEFVGPDRIVKDVEKYFEWKRVPELEVVLMENPLPAA